MQIQLKQSYLCGAADIDNDHGRTRLPPRRPMIKAV